MERYKVDRLKNGETMVNKYLKKEKNSEDRPVSSEAMKIMRVGPDLKEI